MAGGRLDVDVVDLHEPGPGFRAADAVLGELVALLEKLDQTLGLRAIDTVGVQVVAQRPEDRLQAHDVLAHVALFQRRIHNIFIPFEL